MATHKRNSLILILSLVIGIAGHAFAFSASQSIFFDWTFETGEQYGWNGDGHSYDYASSIDFYDAATPDGALGGVWLGASSVLGSSLRWSHLLPNFTGPEAVVSSARLFIDAAWVDSHNSIVSVEGTWNWDPLTHAFRANRTLDIGGLDDPDLWDNGALDVSVFSAERNLRIDRAILMLDYNNGTGAGSEEIPEPASLVLFGIGLVGVSSIMRRRYRKR